MAWVCRAEWKVICFWIPALAAHLGNISLVLPKLISPLNTFSVSGTFPRTGSCFKASLLRGRERISWVFCCVICSSILPTFPFFRFPHVSATISLCLSPQKQLNRKAFFKVALWKSVCDNIFNSSIVRNARSVLLRLGFSSFLILSIGFEVIISSITALFRQWWKTL